ncbi:hypothetical protein EMCRGX_G009023 [Ephydatia muelleri]
MFSPSLHVFKLPSHGSIPPPHGSIPPSHGSIPPSHGSIPPPHGSIPPSHGSIPPPHGSIPPSHGSIPPPHGSIPPPHGSIPPSHGSIPPPHGSIPPPHGSIPPSHGSIPPPHGSIPPPHGSIPPPHGSIPPPHGSIPPSQGSIPPPQGSIPPPHGSIPPPHGSIPPPHGSIPPSQGSIPPPQGSIPPPHGSIPPPQGSIPPSHGSIPPPHGSIPPPHGSIPPSHGSIPPSHGSIPPPQSIPPSHGSIPPLLPRPNAYIYMSPIHVNVHQESILWLAEFIHGVIATVNVDLAKTAVEEGNAYLKSRKSTLTVSEQKQVGVDLKFRLLFSKITLPIPDVRTDGRPKALQIETSSIEISNCALCKVVEDKSFRVAMEWLRKGPTHKASLHSDARRKLDLMSVEVWQVETACVSVSFPESYSHDATLRPKQFVHDFPLRLWLFPPPLGAAPTTPAEPVYPKVSFLLHLPQPLHVTLERLQFLFLLDVKESFRNFQSTLIQLLTLGNRSSLSPSGNRSPLSEPNISNPSTTTFSITTATTTSTTDTTTTDTNTTDTMYTFTDTTTDTITTKGNDSGTQSFKDSASMGGCIVINTVNVEIMLPTLFGSGSPEVEQRSNAAASETEMFMELDSKAKEDSAPLRRPSSMTSLLASGDKLVESSASSSPFPDDHTPDMPTWNNKSQTHFLLHLHPLQLSGCIQSFRLHSQLVCTARRPGR